MLDLLERNTVLKELFETGTALSPDGESIAINSNIRLEFAAALYRTIREFKPQNVLEIGMAFGVSSLAILTALDELGAGGTLISVDPFQSTQWKSAGLASVKRAGFENRHRLVEKFDYLALPELLGAGQKLDFAYIDGWHTFDYTLIDFWYVDKMLAAGGGVAFNDCHLTAVTKVIEFVRTHRQYEEIEVGLAVEFNDYSPLREPVRILKGQPAERFYKQAQDRYFKKTADWEPEWDFYAEF